MDRERSYSEPMGVLPAADLLKGSPSGKSEFSLGRLHYIFRYKALFFHLDAALTCLSSRLLRKMEILLQGYVLYKEIARWSEA